MSDACQSALQRLTEAAVPVVVHPLGFACLRIRDGLCVHVWLPGEPELKATAWPIHCHSWHLDSRVLVGRLENALYKVLHGFRDEATGRLYDIETGPDGDIVTATGRYVRHTVERSEHYEPGDGYSLAAGQFHRTYADGLTVTLLAALGAGGRDTAVGPQKAPPLPRIVPRRAASPALAAHVTDLAIRSLKEFA